MVTKNQLEPGGENKGTVLYIRLFILLFFTKKKKIKQKPAKNENTLFMK